MRAVLLLLFLRTLEKGEANSELWVEKIGWFGWGRYIILLGGTWRLIEGSLSLSIYLYSFLLLSSSCALLSLFPLSSSLNLIAAVNYYRR
jgi:hypothetical protein